jgi:hypothetical protein
VFWVLFLLARKVRPYVLCRLGNRELQRNVIFTAVRNPTVRTTTVVYGARLKQLHQFYNTPCNIYLRLSMLSIWYKSRIKQ